MNRTRVVDVAFDPREVGEEATYTYRWSADLAAGACVAAPLGARSLIGFITADYEATESELGFPLTSLRSVTGRIENLSLPTRLVEVLRRTAAETLAGLPSVFALALPPGAKDRLTVTWRILGRRAEVAGTQAKEVLRTIHDAGGFIVEAKGKPLAPGVRKTLLDLAKRGIVARELRVSLPGEGRAIELKWRLSADDARVAQFLATEGKRKPAQAVTLIRLQGMDKGEFSRAEIKALAGVTEATIKALIDAGYIVPVGDDSGPGSAPPTPNPYQQIAIDSIVEAVVAQEARRFLLFGVTGSGKTEVYLRAAAEALRNGRQVLFLVPEIALATQSFGRLRERFGPQVAVLHSELPAAERLKNWLDIRSGRIGVVMGARSAVLAPLENIGLIIVDEEHEGAYKQETMPRYHAGRMAELLAEHHRCPVVFGSATPSVERFYDTEASERGVRAATHLLTLPFRAANSQLPTVSITNLTVGYRAGQPSILGPELHVRLEQTLTRQQQAILFLNRRAYAPFVICRDCGHRTMCPNCAVSLSYHRGDQRLKCHHCGFHQGIPANCPNCRGERLSPFGIGTEKVEQAVAELFPTARVARLDRDVASKKGALEDVLARFRSGDIDVLVGTQMVAKGLDFPNVTLVGVIAADVSLNVPDFRSSERTFQLLSQVAGRAGRGKLPGFVVIQTFNPDHKSVSAAAAHDFSGFYEEQIRERREAHYPPYTRLINIIASGEDRRAVNLAMKEIAHRLQSVDGVLLGPVDCPIERLQTRWRRHVLLKLPSGQAVEEIGVALLGYRPEGVTIAVDVDPYSLM